MKDLDSMQSALDGLRRGELTVQAFSAQLRERETLLQRLPGQYREVLADLLDRLESGALFTEESCSFSQGGLLDNLQVWIDKARSRLANS